MFVIHICGKEMNKKTKHTQDVFYVPHNQKQQQNRFSVYKINMLLSSHVYIYTKNVAQYIHSFDGNIFIKTDVLFFTFFLFFSRETK